MMDNSKHSAEERRDLRRYFDDLNRILGHAPIWSDGSFSRALPDLLDVLLNMLELDFAYVCFKDPVSAEPSEMARIDQTLEGAIRPQEVGDILQRLLGGHPRTWPSQHQIQIGDKSVSTLSVRWGNEDEGGTLLTGSGRSEFPEQAERLGIRLVAVQVADWLREARILNERKRVSEAIDQQVQLTNEVSAVSEERRQEIIELRRVVESLRVREIDVQLVVDAIPAPLAVMTAEGQVEAVNQPVLDYFGKTVEELKQWSTIDAVHPDDLQSTIRAWRRAVEHGEPYEIESRHRRSDGIYRWFHVRGFPLRDVNGHIVRWCVLQIDVEDRKRAEEELRDTQAKLAHMARVMTMGELTASIAHEISQPLSGIVTNASTGLRMLTADPPNVVGARETVRRTIRDGNRASDIIGRLRALFNRKAPETRPVDLNEATREVIALSLDRLRRDGVRLRTELAADLPVVAGDRVQLQQVILNLVQNALDAMSVLDDQTRELTIRTESEGRDRIRLSVLDSGPGFDPAAKERLFDAFYTTKGEGMGIGLSVSRSIIENHHGRLWAAPNDGPGATFSFSIPRTSEGIAGGHEGAKRTFAGNDVARNS
jgi:PAS domain S-box-containing protein